MGLNNIASTGLMAFQGALTVIGNNIANATTKGYSRQTIQLVPGITQKLGNSYLGTGVSMSSIVRNADQFANYQVRNTSSVKSQYDSFYQQASQIDKLLSSDGINLSASMQNFFTAFNQMNTNPSDSAARTVVMKQSQLLTSQFNYLQTKLNEYQSNSTVQIKETIGQVNIITTNIASINRQLVGVPNSPDLLDQRDVLVEQLAQYMDVSTVSQSNGTINVMLADGTNLVTAGEQHDLSVGAGRSSNFGTQILLGNQEITSVFHSGAIKGLLDFESNIVGKTSQIIGQMSIGLAQAFNAQNSWGIDLNNQPGGNLFTDYNSVAIQNSRVSNASTNTGSAAVQVSISDVSQTKISDYELTVTDEATPTYSLRNKSDGTSISLTGDLLTSPTTLVDSSGSNIIDGITITVNDLGALRLGDKFTIAPTRGAAASLNLAISDFRSIALAGPVVSAAADPNNTSQASISLGTLYNNTAINTDYTVTFDPSDPTQYTIAPDPTVYTLDDNNTIYLPPGSDGSTASYSVKIVGTPNVGDIFTLGPNPAGGVGDNGNGLLLAGIQNSKVFSGGTESLVDRYADLVSGVGADTNDSKLRADSADVIYNQALDFQSSKSGVNLEEEAADLLKFQQAYQAAGKLMQVASQMMDILFDVVG